MKRNQILLSIIVVLAVMISAFAITTSAAGDTYVVAGEAGLCGSSWSATDTANAMTLDETSGCYYKVYTNVAAGQYNVKTVKNGSDWYGDANGWNVWVLVTAECNTVVVLFNPSTSVTSVVSVATVAGEAGLCGSGWSTSDTANDMAYDASTGLFTKTYEDVAAGTYQFKVALNHSWDVSYGKDGGSDNQSVTVAAAGSRVIVTFNPLTKAVNATVVPPFAVGNTGYATFNEAFNAANDGDTVTLNQDVELATTIQVTKNLTIDGNGHTLTYTGSDRAITVENTANGAKLTIKNLTVDCTASYCQRGINYNTTGSLTLDGVTVKGTNVTYAVNLPGSSDGATVAITNSTLTGNIALNIWGAGATVNVTNTHLTSVDNSDVEGYAAVALNNNGAENSAEGTVVTISGGSITARDENGDPSAAIRNATATSEINVSDSTEVVGDIIELVAIIDYGTGNYYGFTTLQAAIDKAETGDTVTIFEGEYDLPSMKAGITVVGQGEVLLNGTLSGTLENLTLKNLHIKGANAQRWAYAKGDLVFESVTFEATSVYALHFDGITEGATLLYKDCTIIGWAAMSGSPESCVFDGCTIKGNGSYGLIRTYFDATIENCTFDVSNTNQDDAYQDGIHAVNATITVNDCTNLNGEMKDIIDTSKAGYVVLDGETIHIHKYVNFVCPCGYEFRALIDDVEYRTISEAIKAADDGDVITILPGTHTEEIKHSDYTNRFGGKSITIVGADDYGTVLTGGLFIGYDDNNAYTGSVTIKGIAFEGEGLSLVQLDAVSVIDCKFTNVDGVAIRVIADNNTTSVTITGNVIDGAEIGIRVRNAVELLIENNIITNTLHNSITIEANQYYLDNDSAITIKDNYLSDWGMGVDGRAIRMDLGSGAAGKAKAITITGNTLVKVDAPEQFIKITELEDTMTLAIQDNMLTGNVKDDAYELILVEGSGAASVDTSDNVSVGANEPHILDGYWWIGATNTGVNATGTGIAGVELNADGELIVKLDDAEGTELNLGKITGEDGRGITDITVNEAGELIISFTEGDPVNLGSIKGEKGDAGLGISKVEIVDGELVITYTEGDPINLGSIKGQDGKGISKIEINEDNELVITYTDGETVNLGSIKGEKGDKGDKGDQGEQGIQGEQGEAGKDTDDTLLYIVLGACVFCTILCIFAFATRKNKRRSWWYR